MDAARTVEIDLRVFGLDAVLKSAHRFTGRCFVEVKKRDDTSAEVIVRPKAADGNLDRLVGDFLNDLLDQQLRTVVAEETSSVRDLIMAHALSKTDLVDRVSPADVRKSAP